MVKLRGHHLVCLHFYHGDGISEQYQANLKQKIKQVQQDDQVTVADGADDICLACPHLINSLCQGCAREEEAILTADRLARELLNCKVGSQLGWNDIKQRLKSAPPDWFKTFCRDCAWAGYCDYAVLAK
jgi:hypothetical protein